MGDAKLLWAFSRRVPYGHNADEKSCGTRRMAAASGLHAGAQSAGRFSSLAHRSVCRMRAVQAFTQAPCG